MLLPNNKATGISSIVYEDIKHIHDDFLDYIIEFYNDCMKSETYPEE